jgi:hypothetical protein
MKYSTLLPPIQKSALPTGGARQTKQRHYQGEDFAQQFQHGGWALYARAG